MWNFFKKESLEWLLKYKHLEEVKQKNTLRVNS